MPRARLLIPAALIALYGAPVGAEGACAPRADVVAGLAERYGEELAGAGLFDGEHVIEVWRSPETGAWTILVTRADGITCGLASGRFWQDAAPAPKSVPGVPG